MSFSTDDASTTLKLTFNGENRRLSVSESLTYADLVETTLRLYPDLKSIQLSWLDDERDTVVVGSDDELSEALRVMKKGEKGYLRFEVCSVDCIQAHQDNEEAPFGTIIVYEGIACTHCGQEPVTGSYFKCCVRPDVNLCESCEREDGPHFYPMIKIYSPGQESCFLVVVSSKNRATSCAEEIGFVAGARMHRGVTCDGCGSRNFTGDRFKCSGRPDFNLCSICERDSVQPFAMIKLYTPHQLNCIDIFTPDRATDIPDASDGIRRPQISLNDRSPTEIHYHIRCNNCGEKPLVGTRYECSVRPDFNLCSSCEVVGPQPHPMLKHYPSHPSAGDALSALPNATVLDCLQVGVSNSMCWLRGSGGEGRRNTDTIATIASTCSLPEVVTDENECLSDDESSRGSSSSTGGEILLDEGEEDDSLLSSHSSATGAAGASRWESFTSRLCISGSGCSESDSDSESESDRNSDCESNPQQVLSVYEDSTSSPSISSERENCEFQSPWEWVEVADIALNNGEELTTSAFVAPAAANVTATDADTDADTDTITVSAIVDSATAAVEIIAETVVTLQEGCKVQLQGLKKRPELNGCWGVCRRWDEGAERWEVELEEVEDGLRMAMILPGNLMVGGFRGMEVEEDEQGQGQEECVDASKCWSSIEPQLSPTREEEEDGEGGVGEWQAELEVLAEMGFSDSELILRLLGEHMGLTGGEEERVESMQEVVLELLARG